MHGFLATPLIDGEKIFLVSAQKVYVINREEGNYLWSFPVYEEFNRFVQSYGVGKYLYVATSSYLDLGDAYLLAFNVSDGHIVWKAVLKSEKNTSSKSSATSNLIVADNKVCVGFGSGLLSSSLHLCPPTSLRLHRSLWECLGMTQASPHTHV